MVEILSFYILFRNHFFDLKSGVPKINTNVMQLFHGILEKQSNILRSFKKDFLKSLDIFSKNSYMYKKFESDIPKYV